jgi:hypothetical protein
MITQIQEILEIDKTLGVIFFSFDGEKLYEKFSSIVLEIMAPENDWPLIIHSLEDASEAEFMYETQKLYFRKADIGYLLVIMEPDAPAAIVRLNCDSILPTLTLEETKINRVKKLFNRFR